MIDGVPTRSVSGTFCLDYYEDRPARAAAGRLFATRGEGHMVSTVESLDDATKAVDGKERLRGVKAELEPWRAYSCRNSIGQ
ncbi:MAG TPA: hypothetical protein VGG42_15120 [Acidobacteriaceae bacterium]